MRARVTLAALCCLAANLAAEADDPVAAPMPGQPAAAPAEEEWQLVVLVPKTP